VDATGDDGNPVGVCGQSADVAERGTGSVLRGARSRAGGRRSGLEESAGIDLVDDSRAAGGRGRGSGLCFAAHVVALASAARVDFESGSAGGGQDGAVVRGAAVDCAGAGAESRQIQFDAGRLCRRGSAHQTGAASGRRGCGGVCGFVAVQYFDRHARFRSLQRTKGDGAQSCGTGTVAESKFDRGSVRTCPLAARQ
jgi:hypothetical protein